MTPTAASILSERVLMQMKVATPTKIFLEFTETDAALLKELHDSLNFDTMSSASRSMRICNASRKCCDARATTPNWSD